jgi:hypothetical protein
VRREAGYVGELMAALDDRRFNRCRYNDRRQLLGMMAACRVPPPTTPSSRCEAVIGIVQDAAVTGKLRSAASVGGAHRRTLGPNDFFGEISMMLATRPRPLW